MTLPFPDYLTLGGHGSGKVGADLLGIHGPYPHQELESVTEILPFGDHGDVDGIEVLLAREASGEVGLGVGGSVESATERAQESEVTIGGFVGEFEDVGDEDSDGYVVSEFSQGFFRVVFGHGLLSLWQAEFGHGLVDEGFGDLVLVLGGGENKAGGGDVVDQPGYACGVFVDAGFGFGFEEFIGNAAVVYTCVDVGVGLFFFEGMEMAAHGDSVLEVGVGCTGDPGAEGLLSAQHYFERRCVVDGGTEQEAQVGQGVGVDEVGFVDDEYGGGIGLVYALDNLAEEAVFSESRFFAELGNDKTQEARGVEMGEMDIDGAVSVFGKRVDE